MKKALQMIALLFGMASLVPVEAQRVAPIATSEGTAAATLEEIATLAENGTPVMLWNDGRSRYIENSADADGELMLALYTQFEAGAVTTNSQLFKFEKAEGENSYRILSLADNKYMYMSGGSPASMWTVPAEGEEAPEIFTLEVNNADDQTFNFAAKNASAERGATLYLNGDGSGSGHDAATVVGWTGAGGNSAYRVMVPTLGEVTLYTVNYTYNFYDGNSNNLLADVNLSDLLPTEATGKSVEAQLGDTVALPSFDNTTLRSALKADGTTLTDSSTYRLDESLITDGVLNVTVNYSVDPRITFICTMDLSEIGGAEGEYLFPESGDVTQVSTARFAVGDTITPPAIDNFTALTDLSQHVASVSEEVAVVYRPWRLIMANCGFILSDGSTLSSVRNVEIYVDLDSTLTAPDLGELYTFDAEATAVRSGVTLPFVVDAGNIYNGMSLELVYNRVVPFKVSELNDDFTLNEETATWYVLRIRGSKIISSQVGDDGMLICNANVTVDDGALWTIAEAPDGSGAYLLYNKANPGKVLCDVQGGLTYPEFADITGAEMGFDLVNITNGYGLRLSSYYNGQENVMINDLSNAGHIGYWDNAAAWSDAGSTITFEEYNPDNYTFLDGRAYLNAQDCIGGFTAEQLSTVREYIESGDVNMESEVTYICENELDYIPAEERVQFNPDHVYAIISASPEYIQKNNVQYALCASEDSVLSWKEFTDATDKNFQFILKMEKLQAADGSDSTLCSFFHVGLNTYVNDKYHFATSPGLSDDEAYYQLNPVTLQTNSDGAVTSSLDPAAFHVQKDVYYYWDRPADDPDNYSVWTTWSMFAGAMDVTDTEGTIVSYNYTTNGYATRFRFKDLGTPEQVGIGSVTSDSEVAADKVYDLSGRALKGEPEKGIFIKNGKKVVK